MAAAEALWPSLAWSGTAARFTPDRLESELEARFGTIFTAGETSGYPSLHMGHRVVDEKRRVEQYGCTAEVRFLALDGMVSNGFQTWAWDGDAGTGGWGEADLIVQVRPRYADNPLRAWRKLTDPELRARVEQEIAGSQAADLATAATRTVAYLPGLVARLSRDAAAALRDELAARGLAGAALREAFLQEHGRAMEEASIFAHEGRHAIDKRIDRGLSNEELEYRAKLSELAFAPRPFLLLPVLLGANMGDGSPHGTANERVAGALVEWMRQHAAEVAGLDAAGPLLPQVGLLTSDQLRLAAREADPLARDGGCQPK
jgi:hypothetical protein